MSLKELRESIETCENYSHLPELQSNLSFYRQIEDDVFEMLIDAKDQAARAEEVISEHFLEPTGVFAENVLRDVQDRLAHLINTLETHLKKFDE